MTTTSISVQAAQDHPLPEQAPGTVIGGRFEVLSKLGEGMLGAVYCVRNTKTGEKVYLRKPQATPPRLADDQFGDFHDRSLKGRRWTVKRSIV